MLFHEQLEASFVLLGNSRSNGVRDIASPPGLQRDASVGSTEQLQELKHHFLPTMILWAFQLNVRLWRPKKLKSGLPYSRA
jgi:hypothetical protein